MFEFLLTSNCVVDVLVGLEVNEPGDLVASGKSTRSLLAMFQHSPAEAIGHADVEDMRTVGEDVDPQLVFASWHYGSPVGCNGMVGKTQIPFGNDKQKDATA